MRDKVQDIFSQIYAEDTLKDNTASFLRSAIQKQSRVKRVYRIRMVVACASFMLLFFIGGFIYNIYFTAYAYADIDVNPSIELTLNSLGRVTEAIPYNDDGAYILNEVNIRHTRYDNALEKLLDAMEENGYLKQDGLLTVTVQTEDNNRETDFLAGIKSTVLASLQEHHNGSRADVFSVTEDVKKHAHENHVSPAKYLAILALQDVDAAAVFEECREHTISELKQMTNEHGGGHHDDQNDNKAHDENGGHH